MSLTELALPEVGGPSLQEGFNGLVIVIVIVISLNMQNVPREKSILWEITVSVILGKKVYTYMCRNPNGLRDRVISQYSSKPVYKKDILRTVSNTGVCCSSDNICTIYLV
jgi:hypothetical protein